MCHSTVTIAFVVTEYGLALTNTSRKDLIATFSHFIMQLLDLAKDGAELMMESGWLERVAEAPDREGVLFRVYSHLVNMVVK